jgi:hypothetical protein
MTIKVGRRVKWQGPGADRGTGTVTYTTWSNGCYVQWDNGRTEPCRNVNLKVQA